MENFFSIAGVAVLAGVVASWITTRILRDYIGTYLSEKGKNLATKEDIAAITTAQEQAKQPFSLEVEASKAKHQLRTAAIEKRLATHQSGFVMWRRLVGAVHTDECWKNVLACQEWWEENCLYLEPEAREAFSIAYTSAGHHPSLLKSGDSVFVKENWSDIMRAGNVLLSAVSLPKLSDAEEKKLVKPTNSEA